MVLCPEVSAIASEKFHDVVDSVQGYVTLFVDVAVDWSLCLRGNERRSELS
jgi:hypothetical protein